MLSWVKRENIVITSRPGFEAKYYTSSISSKLKALFKDGGVDVCVWGGGGGGGGAGDLRHGTKGKGFP